MRANDIPDVVDIAAVVHPGFFERPAVFCERQRLFPQGARLLEQAGRATGYVISHPWHDGAPPALDSLLGTIPATVATYYIHDLALLPEARGRRAAGAAIGLLNDLARDHGFASMALVAVNGSRRFWEKHGFRVVDRPDLSSKLASYEAAAVMMERLLER